MMAHRALRLRNASLLVAPILAWFSLDLMTAQKVIFVMALAWIVFRVFFLSDMIARFVVGNLVVMIFIVGFYAMLVGMAGSSYGVMKLFWHEDLATRIAAAFFSTLFFGLMFLLAFYSDPNRKATRDRLTAYLQDKRTPHEMFRDAVISGRKMVRSVAQWVKECGWRNPPTPKPKEPEDDQVASAQDDIKRFLAVFFYPFWLLLLLPAVCPAVFPYVPKQLPTKLHIWRLPWPSPEVNNVTAEIPAWLVGIAIWGAGLIAGYFFIWAYIEVNRRLFGILTPESLTDLSLNSKFDRLIARVCRLPKEAWEAPIEEEPPLKIDLRRAIRRFTQALFTIYGLAIFFNLILSEHGASDPIKTMSADQAIKTWSFIGGVLFVSAFGVMAWFLWRHAWDLRRENREKRNGLGPFRFLHITISLVMAIGLALAGLRSAVFLVFLFLAILATGEMIVNRLSRDWNWPIEALPVSTLLVLLMVGWLWITNSSPSKLRLPGLECYYEPDRLKPIQEVLDKRVKAQPNNDEDVLSEWIKFTGKPRPKLVVLAVSGGANRAAFWTAKVIEEIDKLPGLREQLRLITGASGGMVGAAHYVAALQSGEAPKDRNTRDWLIKGNPLVIPTDSLSPLVRQAILGDAPFSLLPTNVNRAWDRGLTLERTWPKLRVNFETLHQLEKQGKIPSLLFSPMLVEDGRQLLISNLNLPFMTNSMGELLHPNDRLYSYPSIEFFELFPEARKTFEVGTAVRLNASFPYASPALYLPTSPYRRVVDAGYYDNYGIATATSWIYHHRWFLKKHTSGVVLIQVRAYPQQDDRKELKEPEWSVFKGLSRAFEFLTSPVEGGTNSREAATLFRNDQVTEALSKWFRDHPEREDYQDFFTTVLFENFQDVSMGWYTTEQEIELVKIGFGEDARDQDSILDSVFLTKTQKDDYRKGMDNNSKGLERLKTWWSKPDLEP